MTTDPYAASPAAAPSDAINRTPGGAPHLLALLWDLYRRHLGDQLAALTAQGKKVRSLERVLETVPATSFIAFSAAYLDQNRVVDSFFADSNLGIRLTDHRRFLVCPPVRRRPGALDRTASVPIMDGVAHADYGGDFDNDAVGI